MAGRASPVPPALHPDLLVVAQPGRTLVRATDRQAAPPWRPPVDPSPGKGHPRLDRAVEHQPETVCLDQDRGRDPRTTRLISSTNSRHRTLAEAQEGVDIGPDKLCGC